MGESIYFTDNFFSAGNTDMYNGKQERVGSLDLKSAFSSGVDILDVEGNIVVKGSFPFLSNGWIVKDQEDREIGKLKQRMAFFSKKFIYRTYPHGEYEIKSDAFSKEYDILDQGGNLIATFKKISGVFQSPAYELVSHSPLLAKEELIAVVMGVNMIIKRNNSAAASGGGT
ncbi:hypothetical protein CFK37_18865 [Virgibacillus phasianinus]|uniref:LURP-one-related family protein n=1 Tax=Virgibacillus phasianinus TaxID=2017483 RepID=A0A220U7I5_9BACI|nr:hypothetical protein [Virgibacillus phasianinus]ASK64070.1 hypothetical protein CFK37_18865 [Virgibacillus phasianinus]